MQVIISFLQLILLISLIVNNIEALRDFPRSCSGSGVQNPRVSNASRRNVEMYSKKKVVEVKMYSRSKAKYKKWNCTNEMDDIQKERSHEDTGDNAFLEYGRYYKGIGKLSTSEECARTCTKTNLPKNCYYKFVVGYYRTLGGACNLCQPTTNTSLTSDCQCIQADGVEMGGIMVINRMFPGPSIQVCLGDLVIVDVTNGAPGAGISIHWHGIYQKNFQYYDGTPRVTQCPINFGETFRYKWRAQNVGTHFYHAHSGEHKPDGVEGAIVIRAPKNETSCERHYDEDGFDNVIMIKDWFHYNAQDHWTRITTRNFHQNSDNILINGKGQWFNSTTGNYTDSPFAVFNVRKNRRYRFRLINSFDWFCAARFTIQDHNVTLIATDGEDIEPLTVTTIGSSPAERYDFVLDTHHKVGTYWIQVRLLGRNCLGREISQVAILRYVESKDDMPKTKRPSYNPGLSLGIIFNDWNAPCSSDNHDVLCVQNLKNAEPVNQRILNEKPDITLYLQHHLHLLSDEELFRPHPHRKYEEPLGGIGYVSSVSNISNIFPASPYLSQYNEISTEMICNEQKIPESCGEEKPCACSHLINIPLNSLVEIIGVHKGDINISHPFHLHGYGFYVMAQGRLEDLPITKENKSNALNLHREKYGISHDRPPVKDTMTLSSHGYTIMRFIADNPGFWLYHCHIQQHLTVGMSLVFRVGDETDLPPKPKGFPKCGNFMRF